MSRNKQTPNNSTTKSNPNSNKLNSNSNKLNPNPNKSNPDSNKKGMKSNKDIDSNKTNAQFEPPKPKKYLKFGKEVADTINSKLSGGR
eukprot:478442-Amorphochlora_amoeboformis.AAC.1